MKRFACLAAFAALMPVPAAAAPTRAPAPVQPQMQRAPQPAPPPPPPPLQYPARVTGKTLAAVCNENGAPCLTYVLGVVDSYVATTVASFGKPRLCFPPQVNNQQIANVAVAYLRAHPEQQDVNAAMSVILGIQAAFPCPR